MYCLSLVSYNIAYDYGNPIFSLKIPFISIDELWFAFSSYADKTAADHFLVVLSDINGKVEAHFLVVFLLPELKDSLLSLFPSVCHCDPGTSAAFSQGNEHVHLILIYHHFFFAFSLGLLLIFHLKTLQISLVKL